MMVQPLPATATAECVLFVSLPSTRVQFFEDWNNWPAKDFARSVGRTLAAGDAEGAWQSYAMIAQRIEDLIDYVKQKGVSVTARGTLDDFSYCFNRYSVITLLTHWRSSKVLGEHITDFPSWRSLLAGKSGAVDLATPKSRIVASITNRLRSSVRGLDDRSLANELAVISNDDKIIGSNIGSTEGDDNTPSREYMAFRLRDLFNEALQDLLLPGNRLEFNDGLYSVSETAKAIPESFAGILDISMCESVFLGDYVKRRCRCTCIVNERPSRLRTKIAVYRQLISLLSVQDLNYATAMAQMRLAMAAVVQSYQKDGRVVNE